MRTRLLILTLLYSGLVTAQHLNRFGHFINTGKEPDSYRMSFSGGGSEVEINGIKIKGSSAITTKYGYVSLSGTDENTSSIIRLYSNKGKEIWEKKFNQTINFALSPGIDFCAFHDLQQICVIDLADGKLKTFNGSNLFALNNKGDLAWYDDQSGTIHFKNIVSKIDEPVYRVLFFGEQALFITRKEILVIKRNLFQSVFNCREGRIFDVQEINGRLYISVKKEINRKFIFNSFVSDDLLNFIPEEETQLQLSTQTWNYPDKKKTKKISTLSNELIVDPLYYYADTIYQPVGNSYCEMQEYTIGSPYPHPGVDLLGTYLQEVRSVKKGYVKAILTTSAQYHWRIAISNLDTPALSQGYLYAHLEETTIPYMVGDSVNEADVVGLLVDFPVTGFVHCHFARILCQGSTWSGNWWTFDNPLSYMINFYDSIPPEFEKTIGTDEFAFRNVSGNYLSPDSLYGSIQVISKVFDRINEAWHDDVHILRYSISPLAAPQIMLLDSLSYEYHFYNDDYFSGSYYPGLLNTIYSRDVTCYTTADYSVRDFYHIVTNSDGNDTIDGNDSLQLFNTLNLPDGSYIFRVTAFDPSGNSAVDSMIIQVKNNITGVNNSSFVSCIKVLPNPSGNGIFRIIRSNDSPIEYKLYTTTGKEITSRSSLTDLIDLSDKEKGIYFAQFNTLSGKIIIKLVKL